MNNEESINILKRLLSTSGEFIICDNFRDPVPISDSKIKIKNIDSALNKAIKLLIKDKNRKQSKL